MSERRPFSELTKDFTPERRRRIDDMKRALVAGMPLHELRRDSTNAVPRATCKSDAASYSCS